MKKLFSAAGLELDFKNSKKSVPCTRDGQVQQVTGRGIEAGCGESVLYDSCLIAEGFEDSFRYGACVLFKEGR
jgi:hypothetical protein